MWTMYTFIIKKYLPTKGGDKLNIGDLKRTAKARMSGNWGAGIGGYWLVILLTVVVSIPETVLYFVQGGYSPLYWILYYGTIIFIINHLSTGLAWMHLDIFDGFKGKVATIFTPFKQYARVLGVTFLIILFTFLWTLLFVIPGIIKGIAYSQAIFLVREYPNMGVLEAITESRRIMNGHKGRYFLLNLSFIGWVIVPIILITAGSLLLVAAIIDSGATLETLEVYLARDPYLLAQAGIAFLLIFVGIIYTIAISFYFAPYYSTTISGFYRDLMNRVNPQAPDGEMPFEPHANQTMNTTSSESSFYQQ